MKQSLFLFFILFIITVGLFIWPYCKTRNAPVYDGNTVIGFPLVVYSFGGGMCAWDGPNGMGGRGQCPPEIWDLDNTLYAVIDLVFILGIPFIGGYGYRRFRKINSKN